VIAIPLDFGSEPSLRPMCEVHPACVSLDKKPLFVAPDEFGRVPISLSIETDGIRRYQGDFLDPDVPWWARSRIHHLVHAYITYLESRP
jgi:hypothetical protein